MKLTSRVLSVKPESHTPLKGPSVRGNTYGSGLLQANYSSISTVSTFCDSWSAQQYADGPKTIGSAQSPLTWWAGLSGQTPRWVQNTGVSSERTDQWYARLPAILADSSKWVYVTTPQNDIGQAFGGYTAVGGPYTGRSITLSNVGAVIQDNITGLINSIILAGKTPIVLSCVGVSTWTAAQIAARNVYNTWLQLYCTLTNSVFVNARTVLTDGSLTAVTYLPGYEMPGGLAGHPSDVGSYFLGKALKNIPAFSAMATRSILPVSTAASQSFGNQILVNCQFGTTTGGSGSTGFTGDDPANFSWSPNATAATVVGSHVANAFGNDLIHTDTYTGAVAQEMRHNQTVVTGISGYFGKTVQGVAQIDVAASNTNFQGVDLRSTNTVDGVTATTIDLYNQVTNAGAAPTEAYTYTFLTPPAVIPAGSALQAIGWSIRSRSTAVGSGGAVFTVRQAGLYVN